MTNTPDTRTQPDPAGLSRTPAGPPLALITGGTRGIGLGIARALGHEGFHLVLCGRRPAADNQTLIAQLAAEGITANYMPADMGNSEARAELLDAILEMHGTLQVLVNNAGMAPRERNHILNATESSFEEVMRVNLQGPYFLTQQCARIMIEQKPQSGRPCIINVNSISASVASTNRGEYCISKAGLSMATKLWAVALAEHGIDVFEIRPGIIATDMTAGVQSKYDDLISQGLLLEPRWGTPEDIGKAAAMLARGDLPYATGQVLVMDGGLTAERL